MLDYELHLFADPTFYDCVGRWEDGGSRLEVTGRPAPPGWTRAERGEWVALRPDGAVLPDQGWKIHVGARPDNAERVGCAVWDYCVGVGVTFKFLRSRDIVLARGSKYAPRSASGKFATIYPPDEAALKQVLTELGATLAGEPAASILSDLRWGPGPLFVRYGGFVERFLVAEDGTVEYAIIDPDGVPCPDRRGPVFQVPPWVRLPEFFVPHRDARHASADGRLPYRVDRALHFSNGGGVYLASRLTDDARVVLKEGRPHAGLDTNGHDAVARLRRERWALCRLAGEPGVPACHDYLTAGGHEFLVEEYVEGRPLTAWLAQEYPLVADVDPDRQRIAAYTAAALRLHRDLGGLLARVHARGVVCNDLHPNNVIVRPDGSPALIDFELADGAGADTAPGLGVAGFADPDLRGPARDRRALAAVGLWLFAPLNSVLALAPEKLDEYVRFIAERFPVPPAFVDGLSAALDRRPVRPAVPAAWPADDAPDWTGALRSMANAILDSATSEREDRLFPGDVRQFSHDALGFAHGAGGVLWALSVTGHGRYPEHEAWLVDAIARAAPRRPGFYDGLHGLAYLADHFDRPDLAATLLDRAVAAARSIRSVDLYGGLAGAALNLLHFADRTGEPGHLDEACRLAARIATALDAADGEDPALPAMARAGLMYGWSGPALFFTRLAAATGDGGYLDLAVRALRRDLDACVRTPSGSLQVDDSGLRTLCYLDVGSGGIALVIDELLRLRADDRLAAALAPLVRACSTEFVLEPNLFRGRGGLLATVSRVGASGGGEPPRILARHLRRLALHAIPYRGHVAFPGYRLLRLSMDLASGTAGILLAVHAATAKRAGFLPFFGTRAGWLGLSGAGCSGDTDHARVPLAAHGERG
jgi:hypothetical protein